MAIDTTEAQRKLRVLAKRLHQGWAEMYAVTEKEMAKVRQDVDERWEEKQRVMQNVEAARAEQRQREASGELAKEIQRRKQELARKRAHRKRHGHSH